MSNVNLKLTLEQLESLSDKLSELQDEGSCCAGWASNELIELRKIIDDKLKEVKNE